MLSAGSFSSPYEHLSQPETKRMVEHYTAYLSDNTRLIANPGLKVHTNTHFLPISATHLIVNLGMTQSFTVSGHMVSFSVLTGSS